MDHGIATDRTRAPAFVKQPQVLGGFSCQHVVRELVTVVFKQKPEQMPANICRVHLYMLVLNVILA